MLGEREPPKKKEKKKKKKSNEPEEMYVYYIYFLNCLIWGCQTEKIYLHFSEEEEEEESEDEGEDPALDSLSQAIAFQVLHSENSF